MKNIFRLFGFCAIALFVTACTSVPSGSDAPDKTKYKANYLGIAVTNNDAEKGWNARVLFDLANRTYLVSGTDDTGVSFNEALTKTEKTSSPKPDEEVNRYHGWSAEKKIAVEGQDYTTLKLDVAHQYYNFKSARALESFLTAESPFRPVIRDGLFAYMHGERQGTTHVITIRVYRLLVDSAVPKQTQLQKFEFGDLTWLSRKEADEQVKEEENIAADIKGFFDANFTEASSSTIFLQYPQIQIYGGAKGGGGGGAGAH